MAAATAPFETGVRAGIRAVAPMLFAVAPFGLSFGVLAQAAGMGVAAPIVLSLTTFAGSAQFAIASILGANGGGWAAAVVAAVLLNARYVPLGVAIAPAMTGPWWRRLLEAQLVVDESWAIATAPDGRVDRGRMIGAGLMLYIAWNASTALGVLTAAMLGDPAALGLDAAFPALFLALLAPRLRGRDAGARRDRLAAVLGAVVALALVPVLPAGLPLVAAAAISLLGLRRLPVREETAVP